MKKLISALVAVAGLASSACRVDLVRPRDREVVRDTWIVTHGNQSVQYRAEAAGPGRIEFTDDDRDVRAMSPGSSIEISTRGWQRLVGRRYTVWVREDGTILRRYRAGLLRKDRVDREAESWIGDGIEGLARAGVGSESRVARILAQRGASGVVDEISELRSDRVRARYLRLLLETSPLDRPTAARALRQAGDEIQSDSELADVLVAFTGKVPLADEAGAAFIQATHTLRSDFERAHVLTTVTTTQAAPVAAMIVQASVEGITSKHERARVMAAMLRPKP